MSQRKVKDAKDLETNDLIYFKGHAKATYMSDGRSVEEAINDVGNGGGVTTETDPIFSASAAAKITDGNITTWTNKQDKITDLDVIRSGAAKGATAIQEHQSLSDYATKDELNKKAEGSIETLDNGNIKVTINGVSKDFMPATPSGDPMHHYYESLGAQWNDGEDKTLQIPIYGKDCNTTEYFPVVHKSKRWYLNLLGNITNEQMAEIVSYPRSIFGDYAYSNCKARTIVFDGNSLGAPISFNFFGTRSSIASLYTKNAFYPSSARNIFYAAPNLKYVLGNPSSRGYFNGDYGIDSSWNGTPPELEEIRIFTAKKNIGLQNSPKLSKTSVLFMVNEAAPTTAITIKLHATAYARVANDEEVIAALEAKNAALQGTGGSVSIVSA